MTPQENKAVWTARGESSLSGTYRRKDEVGGLWARQLIALEQIGDPAITNRVFA